MSDITLTITDADGDTLDLYDHGTSSARTVPSDVIAGMEASPAGVFLTRKDAEDLRDALTDILERGQ